MPCEQRFHLHREELSTPSRKLPPSASWLQNLRSLKDSLPLDEEALQAHQEQLNKKQAEIYTLEAKYEDLAQMMPQAQQEELQQVREITKSTMQQEVVGKRVCCQGVEVGIQSS